MPSKNHFSIFLVKLYACEAVTIIFLIQMLPALILIILSFIYASKYEDIECDGSMMPLPTWLFVNAAVSCYVLFHQFMNIVTGTCCGKLFKFSLPCIGLF